MANTASKSNPEAARTTAAAQEQPRATVTPHLVCADAGAAIDFYKTAFGATELMRLEGPDGRLWHGCIQIGNSAVMLADEFPEMGSRGPKALKGTTVTIHLNVEDADAFAARAVVAGATLVMPVEDAFWGDRYGQVEDPFGHRWSIATHVRDMSLEEIKAAMPAFSDCGKAPD